MATTTTTIQIAHMWDDLLQPSYESSTQYDSALLTALETYQAFMLLFPDFAPSTLYGSMTLLSPGDVWTGVELWRTFHSPTLTDAQTQLLDAFLPRLEAYLTDLDDTTWVSLYHSQSSDAPMPAWSSVASVDVRPG